MALGVIFYFKQSTQWDNVTIATNGQCLFLTLCLHPASLNGQAVRAALHFSFKWTSNSSRAIFMTSHRLGHPMGYLGQLPKCVCDEKWNCQTLTWLPLQSLQKCFCCGVRERRTALSKVEKHCHRPAIYHSWSLWRSKSILSLVSGSLQSCVDWDIYAAFLRRICSRSVRSPLGNYLRALPSKYWHLFFSHKSDALGHVNFNQQVMRLGNDCFDGACWKNNP